MTSISALSPSTLSPLLTPTPTSTASSTSTDATQATAATDPVSLALQKAQQKLQAQLDATTASLSASGQLQSAVSDTQLAAHALGNLPAGTSAADVAAAASKFVDAFNTSVAAAAEVAAPDASGASSPASRNAARVGRDLDLSINGNTATAQALNAVGISRQADGTLVVDAAKFAAAQAADPGKVQAALATVGQAVDQSTSAELATGAVSDDSMAALAQRSVTLTAQQNALLAAEKQFATNLATQQATDSANAAAGIGGFGDTSTPSTPGTTGSSGYSANYGLAAYLSNS